MTSAAQPLAATLTPLVAPQAAEAQICAATRFEETTRVSGHVKVTKVGEGGLPLEEVLMDSRGKVLATNILHPEILVPRPQPAGNGCSGLLDVDLRGDQGLLQDRDLEQDQMAGDVKAAAGGDGGRQGFMVASPVEVEGLPGQDEEVVAAASVGGGGSREAAREAEAIDLRKDGASGGDGGKAEPAAAAMGEGGEAEPSGIVTPLTAAFERVAEQVPEVLDDNLTNAAAENSTSA